MKQMNENRQLFLTMLREGTRGDLDAFADALKIIHEIEQEGSVAVTDSHGVEVKREYDPDNFATAHE